MERVLWSFLLADRRLSDHPALGAGRDGIRLFQLPCFVLLLQEATPLPCLRKSVLQEVLREERGRSVVRDEPQDLSSFGYAASKCGLQRVCDRCSEELHRAPSPWNRLPFSAQVLVSSFLALSSVFQLSVVDRETHRRFTSRDFDSTYWKYRVDGNLNGLLHALQKCPMQPQHVDSDSIHFTVRRDDEMSVSSTEGCKWRLEYIEKIGIPGSTKCSLFFLQYPLVPPVFPANV